MFKQPSKHENNFYIQNMKFLKKGAITAPRKMKMLNKFTPNKHKVSQ